jgi:hypothetical protein
MLQLTNMINLGHIVTTKGDRFPGEIAYGIPFASVKSGLAAFQSIPLAGIAQLFFFIGLLELGFDTVQKDIEGTCKLHEVYDRLKEKNACNLQKIYPILQMTKSFEITIPIFSLL